MKREKLYRFSLLFIMTMLMLLFAGQAMADEPMFWPADRQYIANDGSSADGRAVLTDYDGDGDLDIIDEYSGGDYKWLENNGDGSYKDPVNLPDDFYLPDNNEVDLDGDGDIDYVSGPHYKSYQNYVTRVYLNNGDDTTTMSEYSAYGRPILMDADLDGDLDIVTSGLIDWSWYNVLNYQGSVYSNNGDGTFTLTGNTGIGSMDFSSVDLDNDGDLDLSFITRVSTGYNKAEYRVAISMNNGDGSFTLLNSFALPTLPENTYGNRLEDIISADFNGDGKADLAVYTDNAEVFILIGDGSGNFTFSIENYFGCASGVLSAGDVDNDGDIDIVLVDPHGCGDLGVLKNNGDGTFAGAPRYLITYDRWEVISVATADLNGDGLTDMAVGRGSNAIQMLFNKGGRDFEPGPVYEVSDTPWDIVAADFDGDGDLDLATTGVDVLFNDGTGVFSTTVNYPVDTSSNWYDGTKVHAVDIDRDGDLDIIHPDAVALFNNGNGTFSEPVYNDNATLAQAVADFNGDGYPDLAGIFTGWVNGHYQSTTGVSMNDGTGNFPNMVEVAFEGDAAYLSATDVDNDGDIDLGVALDAGRGTDLLVLVNDGSGNFATQGVYLMVRGGHSEPFGMTTGDYNRDGYADFAFINCYHVVVIGLNNGDGTYRVGGFYSGVCGSSQVIKTADLDGDGADDLVAIEDYPYGAVHLLFNNVKSPVNIRELTERLISELDDMRQHGITDEEMAGAQAGLAELVNMIQTAEELGIVDKGPAQAMLSKALAASNGTAMADASGPSGKKAQAMLLTARQQLSAVLKVLTTVERK